MWETLPDQRSNNEANNAPYLVETARSVAHHAEQVGRPEDGSSREKAEAPAEVAAGAASEAAADAESHKKTFLAPWQRKWLLAWHQRKGPLVQRQDTRSPAGNYYSG